MANSRVLNKADTRYILENGENFRWRPNPDDPYIYISFSTALLKRTYPFFNTDNKKIAANGVQEIPQSVVKEMRAIIREEWINKAKLNFIKFLPKDTLENEAKNKNICFIICMTIHSNEQFLVGKKIDAYAKPITYIYRQYSLFSAYTDTELIHANLVHLPRIDSLTDFDAVMRHTFLHEMAHAIAEFKHPKPYQENDRGPFKDLTCLDSIMAYDHDCQPVVDKKFQLFGPASVKKIEPALLPKIREVYSALPVHLTELDLLAAREFAASWQQRNDEAAKLPVTVMFEHLIETIKTMFFPRPQLSEAADTSCNEAIHNDARQHLNVNLGLLNWLEKNISSYIHDVVNTCDSYFPKHAVTTNEINFYIYVWSFLQPMKDGSSYTFFNIVRPGKS